MPFFFSVFFSVATMMSVCKSLQSVRFLAEPKGIGSILNEELEAKQRRSGGGGNGSPSLRRTLSADMSSQGWIQKNPLRKICSSYELFYNSDSEHSDEDRNDEDEQEDGYIFPMSDGEEEEESKDRDLWSLISLQNQKKSPLSSLIPQGATAECNKKVESLSPWEPCKPYVHPKKRSTLSEQSLLMCTEALGCESGTDSSYQSLSDMDDICSSSSEENEDEEEERNENVEFESEINKLPGNAQQKEVLFGAKCIRSGRSFPPPLSSVSGAAVHMRSIKQDGRLLLQAVKVDSQKYLRAHRHGGRLQLHFIRSPPNCSQAEDEREKEEEFKAPKCSEEHKQEQEFKSQKSAPEEQKALPPPPPPPQRKPLIFSNISNFRFRGMKSDCHNLSISNECFLNFNTKEQQKQSLLKEVRCSSRSSNESNDFHLKFRRDSHQPSSKLSSANEFCKAAIPACMNAFKNSQQSRPPSQSLITTPSLLNYPRNGIRCAATDLEISSHSLPKLPLADLQKSAYSLPKLPLKEGFRRCKERKWMLNWEPYRIAIS